MTASAMTLVHACLRSCLGLAALLSAACSGDSGSARFERYSYAGRAQERVQPGPAEFRNPILCGYYPDPSITRVGADYYLVNSSFVHFPGLPVFHSRDLVGWTQIGNAVDRSGPFDFSGLRASRGLYAPDISFHDGRFYIVGTCVDCGGNFVITAQHPAGPWSDPTWLGFDGIDPSLFWDEGRAYLVNNGPPAEPPRYDGHRAIWLQEFDPHGLRLVGERTLIVNGGVDLSQQPVWIEGPHLLRREGFYYLIAAEGGTGDRHSEVVFRADHPRGPFLPFAGNPILSQRDLDPGRSDPVTSAGHAKLVQTQNGEWWATFLATRPYAPGLYNIGRETFLLPVRWHDGWPLILESGRRIPFVVPRPALPAQPPPAQPLGGDFSYADEFDSERLSPAWIGLRTPKQAVYRLGGGALRLLPGGAALGDLHGVPAFVGRRQQHHVATVATTLRYAPRGEGDRAGLVALQNDAAYLFFGVARIGGRRMVALQARENTQAERLVAAQPLHGDGEVTLTLHADGAVMRFEYSAGGRTQTLKPDFDVRFLSTLHAGGFVGTVIGPYAQY